MTTNIDLCPVTGCQWSPTTVLTSANLDSSYPKLWLLACQNHVWWGQCYSSHMFSMFDQLCPFLSWILIKEADMAPTLKVPTPEISAGGSSCPCGLQAEQAKGFPSTQLQGSLLWTTLLLLVLIVLGASFISDLSALSPALASTSS